MDILDNSEVHDGHGVSDKEKIMVNKAKSLLDAKFKGLYVPLFIKMFIHLS